MTTDHPPITTPNRIVFIDLLRGWATLVMIEVHVFNAFLYPDLRETWWFGVVNFINGLVAPAFLFVAGMVFVIVSDRKLKEFRAFGSVFWKQIGRIGLIWGMGYALHIPFYSFTRTFNETTSEGWLKFYQVDILHCIGAGLLILFLARIVLKSGLAYRRFLLAIGAVSILAAPFLSDIDFNRSLPAFLAAYLNGLHYSQFPFFPWLGFLIGGGMAGFSYLEAKAADQEGAFVRMSFRWGLVLIAVYLLGEIPLKVPFASDDIRANPFFFSLRFGIILLLLVACWYYARIRKTTDSMVLDVSRESLLVYTAHLLIIYGTFWNERSLSAIWGKAFSPFECILATTGLVSLMVVAAKEWGTIKGRSKLTARRLSFATGFVVLLIFFLK